MPHGDVLEFAGVTKRFGAVSAVDGFSARVEPGAVTGFLGPNGAGKTTTMRILLGLVRPSAGSATIGGRRYAELERPLTSVGAVLEAANFHPGRSAANHLAVFALAAGIPRSRVDEVLELVGLSDVAGRKVGGFSLGMRQRLGLAFALLGDPGVLVLDEPTNGLDPEGIIWMRSLLRQLAREGRTVLVSSHLLSEVQQSVDRLLIIAHGRLVFQGTLEELDDPDTQSVLVDAPDRAALSAALADAGVAADQLRTGLSVRDTSNERVGEIARDAGVALSVLQRRGGGLEETFLDLVNGVRVHPSAHAGTAQTSAHASAAEPAEEHPEPILPVGDAVDEGVIAAESPDVDASPAPTDRDAPPPAEGAPGDGDALVATEPIDVADLVDETGTPESDADATTEGDQR